MSNEVNIIKYRAIRDVSSEILVEAAPSDRVRCICGARFCIKDNKISREILKCPNCEKCYTFVLLYRIHEVEIIDNVDKGKCTGR